MNQALISRIQKLSECLSRSRVAVSRYFTRKYQPLDIIQNVSSISSKILSSSSCTVDVEPADELLDVKELSAELEAGSITEAELVSEDLDESSDDEKLVSDEPIKVISDGRGAAEDEDDENSESTEDDIEDIDWLLSVHSSWVVVGLFSSLEFTGATEPVAF